MCYSSNTSPFQSLQAIDNSTDPCSSRSSKRDKSATTRRHTLADAGAQPLVSGVYRQQQQCPHNIAPAILQSEFCRPEKRFESRNSSDGGDRSQRDLKTEDGRGLRSRKMCSERDAAGTEYIYEFAFLKSLPGPSYEVFKSQILELFPWIGSDLARRLAHTQRRRYDNLVRVRRAHCAEAHRSCKAGEICIAPINQTVLPGGEATSPTTDYSGGPPLPVSSLPAKFTCPYCLRMIYIVTRSQWSTHASMDADPYFCTFPKCPRWYHTFSAKRKWENHEKCHRITSWVCSDSQCGYVSSVRPRFTKHLRTQHRLKVNPRVDLLEFEHLKEGAFAEPCHFCGQVFASWSNLCDHLANHLQQLALPVLQLVQKT